MLKEKFAALGMDVVEDDTAPKTGHGAGNLVCTLPGTKEADTIYFTSHMDSFMLVSPPFLKRYISMLFVRPDFSFALQHVKRLDQLLPRLFRIDDIALKMEGKLA